MIHFPLFFNSFKHFPAAVKIIEVSPRDGLQNEKACLSIADKIRFIKKIEDCGLSHIEVGSIVNPKLVPQMANSADLAIFLNNKNSTYSFLTPSVKGYSQIVNKKNVWDKNSQVDEIVLFTAASETFNQKNINCSIADSFERFKPIIKQAKLDKIRIRGSISCSLGCPYEGFISPNKVVDIINRYFDLNVDLIDIADTIGVGTSKDISKILNQTSKNIPMKYLTGHFHDTNCKALDLVDTCLDYGINTFHSSIGGIGGCPFSPKRAGNLSTQHLVKHLHGLGIHTGVDFNKLKSTSTWATDLITGPR